LVARRLRGSEQALGLSGRSSVKLR
jgi:hypothetical protein